MKAIPGRFFRSLTCVFGALFCLVFFVQGNYSLNKESVRRDLGLNFQIDKTGKTEIFITFFAEPPPVERLQTALADSLGCAIENASLEKIDLKADPVDADEDEFDEEGLDPEDQPVPSQAQSPALQSAATESPSSITCYWVFKATAVAFTQRGFYFAGAIRVAPLLELFKAYDIKTLTVTVMHPRWGSADCTTGESVFGKGDLGYHLYRLSVDHPSLPTINIGFGYQSSAFILPLALTVAFLILPVVLVSLLRWMVLRAHGDAQYTAWVRLWQTTSWVSILVWVGWSFIFSFRSMLEIFSLLWSTGTSVLHAGFNIAIYLIPPILVVGICYALMLSVHTRLRGIIFTWKDMARQVLLEQVAGIILVLFVTLGITNIFTAPRRGLLWLVAAFASASIVAQLKKRGLNLKPFALEVGDLRDRIFELAQRCGVKLKQVYVLPEDQFKMVNAMASNQDHIILTNALLTNLTKPEVDAVVGHELGHLKHNHPKTLGMIFVGGIMFLQIGSGLVEALLRVDFAFSLCVLVYLLTTNFLSRKFEYTADMHSAYLMGDARPLIAALTKMNRLMLLPVSSNKMHELISTHPTTANRVEALARFGNIPAEELNALVSESPASDEPATAAYQALAATEGYDLAPIVANESRIFSSDFKKRLSARVTWLMIGALVLVPALVALVAQILNISGVMKWMVYGAGFLAALAAFFWVANVPPVWGCQALMKKWREKLENEGIFPEAWQGIFVGLSPSPELMTYENNTDWDIGYLFLNRDRLCYVGEQARFALRSDQVVEIKLMNDSLGWLKYERVHIHWFDAEKNAVKTLNIHSCAARSILDGNRQSRELAQKLRAWKSPATLGPELQPRLADLPTPKLGEVTGTPTGQSLARGKWLINSLYLTGMAAVAALFSQLSFNPQKGGAALYVVSVTWLLSYLQALPVLARNRKQRMKAKQQALAYSQPGS